jgi:hypothetical protein
LRAVMLLLSIFLAIIPLAGIAWILLAGSITTVDGMFMRDRGLLPFLQKKKPAPTKQPAASEGE